mmetsp:Transcript_41704/g.58183  ORF Transcript_41704/g.58183 Transcript_41704/m.58183 type:complete len:129 (+) Transcript_41704:715-1101(+)
MNLTNEEKERIRKTTQNKRKKENNEKENQQTQKEHALSAYHTQYPTNNPHKGHRSTNSYCDSKISPQVTNTMIGELGFLHNLSFHSRHKPRRTQRPKERKKNSSQYSQKKQRWKQENNARKKTMFAKG